MAVLEQVSRDYPAQTHTRLTLAGRQLSLASALALGGRPQDSLTQASQAAAHLEELRIREPQGRDVLVYLTQSYRVVAQALERLGRPAEAVPEIRKSVALLQDFRQRDRENAFARDELVRATQHLADAAAAADRAANTLDLQASFWTESLNAWEFYQTLVATPPAWLPGRIQDARRALAAIQP